MRAVDDTLMKKMMMKSVECVRLKFIITKTLFKQKIPFNKFIYEPSPLNNHIKLN